MAGRRDRQEFRQSLDDAEDGGFQEWPEFEHARWSAEVMEMRGNARNET
jgi:hypothetical protein